ncbi:hypothetical protein [Terrisporobacter sp.]|uniref:hypothetical protein n=1 Tax=Terrisporobacter sp. TaxID=1965305 RepID=UPI002A8217D9|nr:hypothetical protein [Terrisporobacter sp.]MDY4737757.1 hypothetical protein [Terrisporobacter sp.]
MNVLFSPHELKKLKSELRRLKYKRIEKEESITDINNLNSVLYKIQYNHKKY